MKNVMLVVVLLFFGAFTNAQGSFQSKTIKVLPQSKLTITGDTNISAFECDFDTGHLKKENEFQYVMDDPGHIRFKNAILSLETSGFDCGSRAINRDFHKLIQSSKYPQITLELLEVRPQGPGAANAVVNITIAGKQKEHTVAVQMIQGAFLQLNGKLLLNINDFDLEPPKKLFGMIVVKDEIDINFNLVVQM